MTSGPKPPSKSIRPKKSLAPKAPSADKPSTEKKSVLVVEDDVQIRDMVARCLGSRYHVHQAIDGFAAAELLGTVRNIDLIVCDVMMPRVDGFSLARILKGDPTLKSVPIIFLSAKTAAEDVIKGIGLGARHYLAKPFAMKDLLDKVAKVLGSE